MDSTVEPPKPPGDPVYSYRPSLLGAAWEFRLTPTSLVWQTGQREGRVPYRDIRKVRISFRPVTMQSYRFTTQVWSASAPKLDIASTSWKSMLEQARQDQGYSAFITELHQRIAASGCQAEFVSGLASLGYWPAFIVFVVMAFGLAALVVRALQAGAWAGAAFVAAFFLLFLWQIGGYLRRNRPRSYRPEALPPELLPR
jgi:hypothetical protein